MCSLMNSNINQTKPFTNGYFIIRSLMIVSVPKMGNELFVIGENKGREDNVIKKKKFIKIRIPKIRIPKIVNGRSSCNNRLNQPIQRCPRVRYSPVFKC